MKKVGRHQILLKARRTREVCVLVCASMLVLGTIMASFTPTSSLQHFFSGGTVLNHDLIKELQQFYFLPEHLFSMHTNEVNQDDAVSQDSIGDRLMNSSIIKETDHKSSSTDKALRRRAANYPGSSKDKVRSVKLHADEVSQDKALQSGIKMEKNEIKMKGTWQRCTKSKALLKVFMYDLPPELHFGMIEPLSVKEGKTWPTNLTNMVSYPGGLNQQHSPEYWLTLDLLNNLEEEEEQEGGHNAINSPFSKVMEGHAHGKFKGHDVYNASHPKVDEGGHSINHSTFPKVEKGHGYEFLEEVHDIDYSYPKVGTRRPCGAIRVKDARDADVYFVPFFASLSYNKYSRLGMQEKDRELQMKVVNFVVKQEAWKRSQGRDHVIVMHHPNSLHMARTLLEGATFVVADFGRFSSKVAHFSKDIVAPYKHIIPSFHEDNSSFHSRHTLLFFQGAILRKEGGIIRKQLYHLIKNEKGVVFKDGVHGNEGIRRATKGMRSSKFCLHLAGDTPSSNRLFDAIASHCVPVIISKDIELPYEDALDYSEFCIFVDSSQALKKGFLIDLLRNIQRDEWTKMWERLKEVQVHFEYQFPSQVDDAVQMLWKSISHKVPTIKQDMHKLGRYSRSNIFKRNSFN